MKEKTLVSWSGGKDCTLALHELLRSNSYDVAAFVTTITTEYDRVSMHGVRRSLLEEQAVSLGFPLEEVLLSKDSPHEEYEARIRTVLEKYRKDGVSTVVFGDVFLEDVRRYREDNLSKIDMRGVFPLWKRDTGRLARDFIAQGFQAMVTCVDSEALDYSFVGRVFDQSFVADLPSGVDPCGENGEFHSFVFDGPLFRRSVGFVKGTVVVRDHRFYYCDLLPMARRRTQSKRKS